MKTVVRFVLRQALPKSIESVVANNDAAELMLSWARGFRADELTVEDIQECLATLDVRGTDLPRTLQERIIAAQRELDAIWWGMCEAGQRLLRLSASSQNLSHY